MYKDLSSQDREIRLLTILPGPFNTELVCKLTMASLHNDITYEALSYTWGDRSSTRSIRVNDEVVEVTTNLERALRHIRFEDRHRIIWVDAICINQCDDNEKGYQVPLMGEIFSRATICLAWLGMNTEYTARAVAIVKALAQGKHYWETPLCTVATNHAMIQAKSKVVKDMAAGLYPSAREIRARFIQLTLKADFDQDITTEQRLALIQEKDHLFSELSGCAENFHDCIWIKENIIAYHDPNVELIADDWCSNPYWSRLWTWQEICIPRQVQFLWSESTLMIEEISGIENYVTNHESCCNYGARDPLNVHNGYFKVITALNSLIKSVHRLFNARAATEYAENDPLRLLAMTRERLCTKAHDHVFGLLGIAPYLAPNPDYQKSVRQSYIDASLQLMRRRRDLDILMFAGDWIRRLDLPS